ncbi:MAG: GTPase [Adlercreutzia equolifaciens]
MSLNDTPSGERAHIVFFGVRNAGKSCLVNALTSQTVSVVSDVAGTTTDPVRKAMELAPAGPCSSSTPRASTTPATWATCVSSEPRPR